MNKQASEVWITGVGLVSCFGEGAEHHWNVLSGDKAPAPIRDCERFAPYCVHPLPEIDWSAQIPRRGDQRQMENWQRLGTYTAGLALDDAGVKEDEDLISTMDLVVAAGGGERDIETDNSIMNDATSRNDRDHLLLERLPNDLRPTLFLAQLSNLLAGNISIVHKVTGSSRTYMGEENAGITAIENAAARIAAGQSTHALVGGSYNAERPDLLLSMELNHLLARDSNAPVWARQEAGGGVICGTAGAFLVLEAADFARARGAKCYAKIASIKSDLGSREEAATHTRIAAMFDETVGERTIDAVISGAAGSAPITALELAALRERFGADMPIRAFTSLTGHPLEANFPLGVALAALALKNHHFYPPFEQAETAADRQPASILVTAFGSWKGEGVAVVEAV